MWPRWGRVSSPSVAAAASNPSFSFRDLRSLVNEDAAAAGESPAKSNSAAIRSAAVFHRVRVASAALRAWRSLPAAAAEPSPSPAAEEKTIVVYYTSLRVVRKTFEDCRAVRSILRGFRVAIDERDLSMDSGFLTELKQILGKRQLALPRVFIGGRYVGGFEEIQSLHENGELKKLIEGAQPASAGTCEGCGGMRFVLCHTCSGSHKYYSEKSGFRSCTACNENGLLRCPECCGD